MVPDEHFGRLAKEDTLDETSETEDGAASSGASVAEGDTMVDGFAIGTAEDATLGVAADACSANTCVAKASRGHSRKVATSAWVNGTDDSASSAT